jgi:hypothetical protein
MFKCKPYSQQDPAWKNKLLGFASETTIGKYGCLLTCMAMTSSGFGYNETPASLNDKLRDLGPNVGFQEAMVIPATLPRVLPQISYTNFVWCREQPAPINSINAALDAGMPVIVEVDYSNSPGLQNHWVLLYERRGIDYLIHDPWPFPVESGEMLLTKSRYGFAGSPANIITAALFFEGPTSPQPPHPTPSPQPDSSQQITIYTIEDALALRTQPFIGTDNLVKRLPLLSNLTALEPLSDVQRKLGFVNQWLKVRDQAGSEGYAAAWYLSDKAEIRTEPPISTPPEPTPMPPDNLSPAGLVVQASVDGLALRSNPVVADNTLLKRLPFDAELLVLENTDPALKKIGVVNQWLKVRDIEGMQGYVAAWYVSLLKHPPLGPMPVPEGLLVRATADGLALRTQPVIAENTLIHRLAINAELKVLDNPVDAFKKIGAYGQWLKVRTIANDEGYVAAWYVTQRPQVGG